MSSHSDTQRTAEQSLTASLLAHFDRERIPERVVHAKGSGAHGKWVCTDPLDDLCIAGLFKKGAECPVTVRFSTVGGESGSSDNARDPRGFAVKFKSEEGNWDFVGNNTPVFFLRDPTKFPHFIHTQKVSIPSFSCTFKTIANVPAPPRYSPWRRR